MVNHKIKLGISLFLLMFMSIGLTVSTLHSHHNLELHNSVEFADTGHCLNADTTLCPICGYVLEGDMSHTVETENLFVPLDIAQTFDDSAIPSRSFIPVLGRAPPLFA